VLTQHPRDPIEMEGGTTFTFVTEVSKWRWNRRNAQRGSRDVRIGGGVEPGRQYLQHATHIILSW